MLNLRRTLFFRKAVTRVHILILVVIIAICIAAMAWFTTIPSQKPSPSPAGSEDVIFRTVEGTELTVQDLLSQGKPVVIYFFTTWCPTCERDLKTLDEVYREQAGRVNVLVVSFDPSETAEQIKTYKEKRNYTWPFAEYNEDAIVKYKVVTQSSKIGISRNGEVVFSQGFGFLGTEEWRELLQQLTSS